MRITILSLVCLIAVLVDVAQAGIISVDNFKLVREHDSGCDNEVRPEYSIMDSVSNNARLELMERTILDAGMEHLFQQQQQQQQQLALQNSDSISSSNRLALFAPTNAAFWNLDMTRPGFLLLLERDDWTFHLQDLVLQHVTVEGEFCRDSFFNEQKLLLQNGGEAQVEMNDNGLFLLSSPYLGDVDGITWRLEMVEFDESASNGVIHEVSRVFLTRWFFRDAFLAANEEGYSTFSELVTIAGLEGTFGDKNRIMTVFYPTNEAFAQLPQETLQCWREHPDILAKVLFSHAVHGVLHSTTLQQQSDIGPFSYTDLHGMPLSVDSSYGVITFNGSSRLVQADILTYNGISHGLDKVLLFPGFGCPEEPDVIFPSPATPPPSPSSIDPILTVLEFLHEQPNYSTISHMVAMAGPGLESILSDSSAQLTFFAPVDNAFEHVPPEILSCLMTPPTNSDHSTLLSSFILYHLVNARKLWSSEIAETNADTMILTTAEGAPLLVHHSYPTTTATTTMENFAVVATASGEMVMEINDDGAIVVDKDIPAYNGVIHGISRALFSPDFSCSS